MTAPILVSACLTGRACRYDGHSKPLGALESLLAGMTLVPVCPEELGGLGTPRPAATLQGGDGHAVLSGKAQVVRVADGVDVTRAFVQGAQQARAQAPEAFRAILKARSPSCGCGQTNINGQAVGGDGVFAALLHAEGVQIQTDEELVRDGFGV